MDSLRTRGLHASGWSNHEIRRDVRQGRLHRLGRGLYLRGEASARPDELHRQAVRAGMARLHPDSVVSHASAAAMHHLPVPWAELERLHITRSGRSGGARRAGLVISVAALAPEDVVLVAGVRTTSVARTLVDLARTVPLPWAVAACDHALREGLASRAEVIAIVDALGPVRGTRAVRRMVELADGRAESVGESLSRVVFAEAGLPMPRLQVRFGDADGPIGRVDFYWNEQRVVGEFDGRVKYLEHLRPGERPEDAVWREKRREDRLRALGHLVVRWTWDEIFTRPDAVIARVRPALLGAAAPQDVARPVEVIRSW